MTSRPIVNGGLVNLFALKIVRFDESCYAAIPVPALNYYAYLDTLHWLKRSGLYLYQWYVDTKCYIILPDCQACLRPQQPHYHLPI